MKSKIIGLIIGIIVLGSLLINTLLEAPAVTGTITANTEIASSTISEIKVEKKQVQTIIKVQDAQKQAAVPPTEQARKTQFTFAEVTVHNNKNDCWSIVNSNVYELTSWISKHPGGEREIISMCGKDATSAFDNQHGGDSKPEKILASYYIGTLIN